MLVRQLSRLQEALKDLRIGGLRQKFKQAVYKSQLTKRGRDKCVVKTLGKSIQAMFCRRVGIHQLHANGLQARLTLTAHAGQRFAATVDTEHSS